MRALLVISLMTVVACVDEEFKVKDTSLEVTLGGEDTLLPLATMDKTSIKELFDMDKATDLRIDEEGNITYIYGGAGDSIDIEAIDTSFEVPASTSSFVSEGYPLLGDIIGQTYNLREEFTLTSKIDDVEISNITIPVAAGVTITGYERGYTTEIVAYDVPDEVMTIERLYFEEAEGRKGAEMTFTVDFNDLNAVNGGGKITMWLKAPTGFVIYDENDNLIDGIVSSVINHEFAAAQASESFVFYLESIENHEAIKNGSLEMPIDLEYHISFEMTTTEGELTLVNTPTLSVDADFVLKDADITLNEVVLADGILAEGGDFIIAGLPAELLAINNIDFSKAYTTIFVKGLDWLSESVAQSVAVDIAMPETLQLSCPEATVEGSTLKTNLAALHNSVGIYFEALDFGEEGLIPVAGEVEVALSPTVTAKIEAGTQVRLTDLIREGGTFAITTSIDAMSVDVESVSGRVDYGYELSQEINILNGSEEFDLTINGVSLSPVVIIEISNPMALEALLSATLTPVVGGFEQPERRVSISDVVVRGAEVTASGLEPKLNNIVLAMAERAAEYAGDEYTFVEADILSLLTGEVPEKLILDIEFHSNPDSISTVYALPNMSVDYDYSVVVPLQSRDDLDVLFGMSVDGFSETLVELSEYDIRVGDIAVVAVLQSTLPLGLEIVELEAVDVDGNPTDAQIVLPNNEIRGSKDGIEPATTELVLELQLDANRSIASISNVDGLRFKVRAKGDAEERVWVNENQWISLDVKLRLGGGISVDLRDFIDEEEQEEQ